MIKRNGQVYLFTAAPYREPKVGPRRPRPLPTWHKATGSARAVADDIWDRLRSNHRYSWEDTSPFSRARMARSGSPIAVKRVASRRGDLPRTQSNLPRPA